MKEQITKFDLADAFKALDDIAAPSVKGIRANRMDLSEATKRVDRLSMLVEDYYDVQDQGDLEQANNDMQADVAKAKLAKIEKIVDLDAETPEDIQPSYVGKTIIQCPQCMTLFYKDAADIEKSVEDPDTVNVGEICQHCGNDSGYTLIGKVAEETPDEIPAEEPAVEEAPVEEPAVEEAPAEETPVEEETAEVELPELDLETEEEPAKQESLHNSKFLKNAEKDIMNTKFHSENLTLNEDLDDDMAQFNAYIDYLQNMLKQDEEALEKAKKMKANELTIQIIEKRIAADKEDLEAALPQAIKDKQNEEELPTMEEVAETEEADEVVIDNEPAKQESLHNSKFLKNAEKDVMNTEFHSDNLSLNEAKAAKETKYNTYTEIMWALTGGKKIKDELGRTRLSGGIYSVHDTGINYKTNSIKVYGETEEALQPAIDIANQFGRPVSEITFDEYTRGPKKYKIEIQLKPEDYEDGEFEESINRSEMDDYDMIRAGISEHRTINESEEMTEGVFDRLKDKLNAKDDVKAALEIDKIKKNGKLKDIVQLMTIRDNKLKKANDDTKLKAIYVKLVDKADKKDANGKIILADDDVDQEYKKDKGKKVENLAIAATQAFNKSANGKTAYIKVELANGQTENIQVYVNGHLYDDMYNDVMTKAGIAQTTVDAETKVAEKQQTSSQAGPATTAAQEAPKTEEEPKAEEPKVEEPATPATEEAPAETAATHTNNKRDTKKATAVKQNNNNKILNALKTAGFDTAALEGNKNQKLQTIRKALFGEALEAEDSTEDAFETLAYTESLVEEKESAVKETEITDAQVDKLLDTPEYKEPINDAEIEAILANSVDESVKKCELDNVTDIHDKAMNECVSSYLNEVYSNVENFIATNCNICENKVILEGIINFKSGKSKPTTFELKATKNNILEGYNKDLGGESSNFKVKYVLESGKMIYPREMSYSYKINNQLVEGLIKK